MKKIFSGLAMGAAMFIFGATPAFAAVPNWDVSGSWVFDYHYGASAYLHDMTLVQDGVGGLTGNGGYPAGGGYVYPWTIDSGSVSGNDIVFTAHYTATVTCSFTATGTIASDGTMGGTWTDNCDGNRNGTWTTTSGSGTAIVRTCATINSGTITDVNGNLISTGFDKYGYNYQAHIFNGFVGNYSRPPVPVTSGDKLIMKWSDSWIANVDCNHDGKLDRGLVDGELTDGISKGWLTNHFTGLDINGKKIYRFYQDGLDR